MTLCLQSICCLWNIACCDLERSFTQKFVFPAWGVCNLNYKLYFLCCRFLIPQSLKHWFTCDNESFGNRRGSFIYKMSSEAHTWAVIFNSCLYTHFKPCGHMAKKVYLLRKLRTQCLIVKQAIKQLLWKPVNFSMLIQPSTSVQHTFKADLWCRITVTMQFHLVTISSNFPN